MVVGSDDEMVGQFHLEGLTGPDEVAGDADVGIGGGAFSAGMVMGEDEAMGVGHDGGAEDFTRMGANRVQRSDGHQMVPEDAAAGVEEDDEELFAGFVIPRL